MLAFPRRPAKVDDGIEARVAVLERAVAELQRLRSTLSRADRGALEKLLPAIVGEFGSQDFASRDLSESTSARLVLGDRSVKTIGRLLSRAVDLPVDGLIVQRAGVELGVTLWRVVGVVSGDDKPSRAAGDGASSRPEDP